MGDGTPQEPFGGYPTNTGGGNVGTPPAGGGYDPSMGGGTPQEPSNYGMGDDQVPIEPPTIGTDPNTVPVDIEPPSVVDPMGGTTGTGPYPEGEPNTVPVPDIPPPITGDPLGGTTTTGIPADPISSGGAGATAGGADAQGTAAAAAQGIGTQNITFEAPRPVGQVSQSEGAGFGSNFSTSGSESVGGGTSFGRDESLSAGQSTSDAQSQATDQSLAQNTSQSNVLHTFDPDQASSYVDQLDREASPDNPFSMDRANELINQANAGVAASTQAQVDRILAQAGAAGVDPDSPSVQSAIQEAMRGRMGAESANRVNISGDYAERGGLFDQANFGQDVLQRGQDLERQGIVGGIINSLLGQQESQAQGTSESQGQSTSQSQGQSTQDASSLGISGSDYFNRALSQAQAQGQNQYYNNSYSYPVLF
jgi:hypothetical protein